MSDPNTAKPLSPTASALKEDYETLWSSFADTMRSWTGQVRDWAAGDDELHTFLARIQRLPKEQLQAAVWGETDKEPNIGSATGLFFEHVVASAIEARIRSRVNGSVAHRNMTGTHVASAGAKKQPDLILVNDATGRAAVFEFKTSPTTGNLSGVREQKAGWESDPNVRFFLVAGFANGTVAADLARDDWSAVLRTRKDDQSGHTVDTLVDAAVRHLTAA